MYSGNGLNASWSLMWSSGVDTHAKRAATLRVTLSALYRRSHAASASLHIPRRPGQVHSNARIRHSRRCRGVAMAAQRGKTGSC
jgi:hypothetical protein